MPEDGGGALFFALAEEALEAAGLDERGEAPEHARLGGRRGAGHFSQLHRGRTQILAAQNVGDFLHHGVFAEVAVSEKAAGIAVEDFEPVPPGFPRPRSKRDPPSPKRVREAAEVVWTPGASPIRKTWPNPLRDALFLVPSNCLPRGILELGIGMRSVPPIEPFRKWLRRKKF